MQGPCASMRLLRLSRRIHAAPSTGYCSGSPGGFRSPRPIRPQYVRISRRRLCRKRRRLQRAGHRRRAPPQAVRAVTSSGASHKSSNGSSFAKISSDCSAWAVISRQAVRLWWAWPVPLVCSIAGCGECEKHESHDQAVSAERAARSPARCSAA